MNFVNIDDFKIEKECIYDGERYSVRDNGAILRHPVSRIRPLDNKWTFGKENYRNPYLHISTKRVHRIVVTAFQGEAPTSQHVVDHIDTNCRNNRPENLRWVTKLENALLNPITRKKIEHLCGSIEAFLEDPSMIQELASSEPNYSWMRTVTIEEAKNCKERLEAWATEKEVKNSQGKRKEIGEWIYKPKKNFNHRLMTYEKPQEISGLVMAITPLCAQRKWRVPTIFPCCPENLGEFPLKDYAKNLKTGEIFSKNDRYPASVILEYALIKDETTIIVKCEKETSGEIKPYSLAEITFENGLFVHTNKGSFFREEGANKYFTIAQGFEWTGGDVFDDFC